MKRHDLDLVLKRYGVLIADVSKRYGLLDVLKRYGFAIVLRRYGLVDVLKRATEDHLEKEFRLQSKNLTILGH
jgi:hypothetical protein